MCLLFLGEELGPHLTQCGRGRDQFHLDPSKRLATIYRQDRTDRQRSHSIGRTVLQTVAQKQLQETFILLQLPFYFVVYVETA